MGLLLDSIRPSTDFLQDKSPLAVWSSALVGVVVLSIVLNVLRQVLFKNPAEPPMVFHLLPFLGSTITYGIDPYKFFFACREKYGDVFTFILLGKKTTVCLGVNGNEFILNAKHKDLNAEDVYSPLTTPVFGSDVVYDCPNAKLMEQKKFVKFGLTSDALKSYVPLITAEVQQYIDKAPQFQSYGGSGLFDVSNTMAEITIFTASRSLQGREVREKFDSSFAALFHDLDMGFSPINFMFPWAPLPHNRSRDRAQKKMADTYLEIIRQRRKDGAQRDSDDMIWNLMSCVYKDGSPIPDIEIAHMMIALLMAGQHSSSSTSAWILLRLATKPELVDELFAEQKRVLGKDLPPVTYENLQKLTLNLQVVKETLRLHAPIHSILRKVTQAMPLSGTRFVIPQGHNLLAAPGVTSRDDLYFNKPDEWDPHRWDHEAFSKHVPQDADEQVDYGYGNVSKGTGSPYLPFGAGRHRCIGEQFAHLQLGVILVEFVRTFKLQTVHGDAKIPQTDYSSLFSRPFPASIRWQRRSKSS